MSEQRPTYDLDTARANINVAEANRLNSLVRAYLDALSVRRMELYRAAWQGDSAAMREFRDLCMSAAAWASGLPVEVAQ